ncbi:MAG: hemopexin repeat-containing protein [Bacteroidota bacterium]
MKIQSFILFFFLAVCLGLSAQNDKELIQAAILSPHNGQAYFFVGKKVYQYNPKNKSRKIRNLGLDAFRGIPTNVDAALVNPTTGKAFIFRGNKWYRFNTAQGKLEREGVIGSDGFKGLLGPFDGAVRHGTSNRYAFFKGNMVYIYDPTKDQVVYSDKLGENNVYKGAPTSSDAVIQWTNGKVYFFKGDHYHRYDPSGSKMRVDKVAVINRDGFQNLFPKVDAAFYYDAHTYDRWKYNGVMGFVGNSYYEAPDETGILKSVDDIKSLSGLQKSKFFKKTTFGIKHFEGVPSRVDAIVKINETPHFIKGGTVYRYNRHTREIDWTGTLSQAWDGLPSNIDAAFSTKEGRYFFKKDRYYYYNKKTRKLENRSGALIKNKFKGVPEYLDAATVSYKYVYFYKKRTEYVYDRRQRRVVKWNTIDKIAK